MPASPELERLQEQLMPVHEALEVGDHEALAELIQDLHPAEISVLIESTPGGARRDLIWANVPLDLKGEVLLHLNDDVRAAFIEDMGTTELVSVTENLDTDDLADILPEMPEDASQSLLLSMEEQRRERLETVLVYDEDSAGGLMNTDTIAIRGDISLETVMRYLRFRGEIPETTDNLYVVNRDGRYMGLLYLTDLLTKEQDLTVAEVMNREVKGIPAVTKAKEVASIFEYRDLVSAPVIDDDGNLLGRITIDDIVDVIRDEADHAFMSQAGLNQEDDMFAPVVISSRRRAVWLGVNLITALLASVVIGMFDATIEQIVALAVLMPIVASMGGIAGSQTLTLVIRGMALGQIGTKNAKRLMGKEIAVGALNGIVWAIVIAIIAALWFKSVDLGYVIGAAIVINLLIAALSGVVIPMLLDKLGADPALAGGVVLTTVTDVVGFFAFLGLASLFLL